MQVKINTTVKLTYSKSDTLKISAYYTKDDFENYTFETKEMNFFTGINLVQTIDDVKEVLQINVYISSNGMTHKFRFTNGLDHQPNENIQNISISIIDGRYRPSVMVNNFGSVEHETIDNFSFWSCFYCGASKALDKVGTPDECCVIL